VLEYSKIGDDARQVEVDRLIPSTAS
jgi:hypothetical protein